LLLLLLLQLPLAMSRVDGRVMMMLVMMLEEMLMRPVSRRQAVARNASLQMKMGHPFFIEPFQPGKGKPFNIAGGLNKFLHIFCSEDDRRAGREESDV